MFAELARADGIDFSRGISPPWLTNKGHLSAAVAAQPDAARAAAIGSIYTTLGGDETLLAGKRSGSDPRLDFLLHDELLAVEVDEIQHFTTIDCEHSTSTRPRRKSASTSTPTGLWSASGARQATATGHRSRPSTSHSPAADARSEPTSTPSAISPPRASAFVCCASQRQSATGGSRTSDSSRQSPSCGDADPID